MRSPANPLDIGFCLFSSDVTSARLEGALWQRLEFMSKSLGSRAKLSCRQVLGQTAGQAAKQKGNSCLCAAVLACMRSHPVLQPQLTGIWHLHVSFGSTWN